MVPLRKSTGLAGVTYAIGDSKSNAGKMPAKWEIVWRWSKGLASIKRRNQSAGAEGQNRTVDTGIFSAVLYQLSYLGE